jgi:putative aldouronate transport system substrate-binding protein
LQEIKKITGYTINMTYTAGADYATRLNALIAARTLPDLFYVGVNDAIQLIEAKLLTDLTDMLPIYAPTIMQNIGDQILNMPANKGGQIYCLMLGRRGMGLNTVIRTDWLTNVNMSMPTDLDSFYAVLKAFTEGDPNKSGKKDTFGLTCGIGLENYASIFGAYDIPVDRNIQLNDGTVTTWFKHPNILDAIKYIRRLYSEGLMERDFATIPNMEMFGRLWTGVAGVIVFRCYGPTNNWMPGRYIENPPPTFGFATLAGPGSSGGVPKAYPNYVNGWVIASSCPHPTEALRFLDFCTTEEGNDLLYIGVENTMYRWLDKSESKYERIEPYKDDATQRAAGAFVYNQLSLAVHDTETRLFNKQTREGIEIAHAQALPDATIFSVFQENIEYGPGLKAIIAEAFAQLVVTTGDIDAEYTSFMKRWDDEGGKKWEVAATAAYKAENQ